MYLAKRDGRTLIVTTEGGGNAYITLTADEQYEVPETDIIGLIRGGDHVRQLECELDGRTLIVRLLVDGVRGTRACYIPLTVREYNEVTAPAQTDAQERARISRQLKAVK